jgi:hypothetical protein
VENLPLVVRAASAENSEVAGCGKTKRKTVECLVTIGELLMPSKLTVQPSGRSWIQTLKPVGLCAGISKRLSFAV